MSAPPSLTRLWFMDWHGRVLSHDPIRDDFAAASFQPGIHSGLSALVPFPLNLPCDVTLEKRVSMPRLLPELEMLSAPNGLVCFQAKGTGHYLKSVPGGGEVVIHSSNLADWEYFLPMSEDFLRGLSALLVPQAATLTDTQTGQNLPPLQLQPGCIGEMDGTRLSLAKNTQAIEQLGRLPAGQTEDIPFHVEGNDHLLTIRVQRPS